jgi:Leucine-rich repeat (LRR) protein
MKQFIKKLTVVILAAAILLGTAWYFLEYDPDFTHDVLLTGARFFEDQGFPTIATWMYDRAYKYGQSIEQISLELAKYYRSIGNYSKVEETLLRAVRDGGGVNVYIDLCQAFVKQDKLLDAYQLIENAPAAIKEKLNLLRPAAPVPDSPAGHYDTYLALNFHSENGKVYISGNDVPSIERDLHTAPVTLAAGDNVFFTIAVGENGLVSPLTEYRYTVKGVVEPVVFTDPAMGTAIREAAGFFEGTTIYTNNLWEIKEFTVPAGVVSLEDLKHLPYLETLTISSCQAPLTPLANLPELKTLTVKKSILEAGGLQAIFGLSKLEKLTLRGCSLSTVAGIEALKTLTTLDLGENVLRDLTPLSNLATLQILQLDNNAVTDLNALSSLKALQELNLSYNSITNVSQLQGLTALQNLNLCHNQIKDVQPISKLSNLTHLDLSYNKISSATSLSACKKLIELNISNNTISSIYTYNHLTALEVLDFSYNKISSIPSFPKDCALTTVNGTKCSITSIEALSGLKNLNSVTLDYNGSLKNISNLSKCPRLVMVSVYGTKVKDVKALTNNSVVVYYTP